MPPKPKAMKVLKLNLKRPAGLKDVEKNKQGMSLEEKMELFAKHKNKDVNEFLDGLTKNQREALWQKFASARASLKDAEADSMWQEVAKGKGSDPAKKELLSTFLKMGGELKGNWLLACFDFHTSFALLCTCQRAFCPDPKPLRPEKLRGVGPLCHSLEKVWPPRVPSQSTLQAKKNGYVP